MTSFSKNILVVLSIILISLVHPIEFQRIRYVPRSSQWKIHAPKYPSKNVEIDRRLDVPSVDEGSPPDWDDLDNYHHKIAEIIKYETSAEVHLPGSSEYKRRRVRNGTCNSIHPDMVVVPKFESDISRILQISNIVGVPISVRSEGRSYNLCKSVKPIFGTDFLPNTQGLHLDMREEAPFEKIKASISSISPFVPSVSDVFKTSFQPSIVDSTSHQRPNYREVARVIKATTLADVHMKGSVMYEKRRELKNGMCKYIYPDLVVVPKSTEDVSKIIKTASHYNTPISVRSGGHSYTCQSVKPEGIFIDMRKMNKVQLTNRQPFDHCPPGPAAILGPGSTWGRVLKIIPRDRFSYVHGQCTEVGVGGYLLGGGVNVIGTSQRLTSGASNVLQYTMVDAKGDVYKVSLNNMTRRSDDGKRWNQVQGGDNGLFRSLQLAGGSFGIATEFTYGIFDGPEVLPVCAFVYIENQNDLANFERAALSGRYHLTIHAVNFFTKINWSNLDRLPETTGRLLMKVLPILHKKKAAPVVVTVVDNFPKKYQKHTSTKDAFRYLRKYGLKIALDEDLTSRIHGDSDLSLMNYEFIYMDEKVRKRNGPDNLVSANFMNLTTLSSMQHMILDHPLFGFKHTDKWKKLKKRDCEFCFLVIVGWNMTIPRPDPMNAIEPTDLGSFQVEMTCLYKGGKGSSCPKTVYRAKTAFQNSAIRHGERLTQYYNTPSCDKKTNFKNRYWKKEHYEAMLKAKAYWDPKNMFNFCHSVGSTKEDCCPHP